MHSLSAWIAEIIAFLVVVFVLYRFVWPLAKNMATERQDAIQQQVEESEAATRRLEEAQRRFDEAVAEARQEAARIRDDARADAHRLREELKEQAEREVERIRQRGEEQLVAQRDLTVRRLRAEIAALALEQAEGLVRRQLADEGARSATVDAFLDDLERLPGRVTTPAAAGGNH